EAIRLAQDQRASLCFLHVVDSGSIAMHAPAAATLFESSHAQGARILADAVDAAQLAGVQAETRSHEIFSGRAGAVVVEEAEKYRADLIVMGTHGRRGIGRALLGSDASLVLSDAKVPVLMVK